jgi:DNA-binding transcriptional LysR family regulator
VADSLWGIYASRTYIERHGKPERIEDLSEHAVVGFDETMANHRASTWLRSLVPEPCVVARNNSVLGLVYAVKAGLGVAPLPTALGDSEQDLVRVLGPIPELTRSWRLLAHPEMRHTRPVSAFFDFVVEEIDAFRPILTG